MLGTPAARVCRVNGDDRYAGVGGHLGEPVAQPRGGNARHQPAEAAARAAALRASPGVLATFGPGLVEVEVLDEDCPGLVSGAKAQDLGDRASEPAIASGTRQAGQLEADGVGGADRVARRVQDHHREVSGVHVDRHHPMPAQPVQTRGHDRRKCPRGVEIPPSLGGVEADVVTDRASGCLGSDIATAIGEGDRAGQPVTAVGAVGQMRERRRELDLEPTLVGMPTDRLVAPRLGGFAVGADEQPLRLPLLAPGVLVQAGFGEVVASAGEAPAAFAHAHPSRLQAGFDLAQPGLEHLEPALGLPPLRLGGVPTGTAPTLS